MRNRMILACLASPFLIGMVALFAGCQTKGPAERAGTVLVVVAG